jgi:ferric-dicitrate binding protein FerR (iron transport regulator)
MECVVFLYVLSSLRRRPPAAALVALLLLAASPAVVRAQEVAAMPSPWIVVESHGPAEIRHDRGTWLPLVAGLAVAVPSEIRTGPAAEVLLKRGNDRVHLMGQSYLELPPAAADDAMTRLVQWLGQALFEVDHRPDPHFEVDTPYLAAIVKGTTFTVEVTRDDSAVAVTQGVVAVVTPGGASTDVRAGMVARGYAGLSGLTVEDDVPAAAPGDAPSAESDHQWPTPDFQPIAPSFPQM